ncbi:unnamed protein product, partial [Ilex paraguariensis]
VKLEQGLQVLKIFRDHCSKQCILDDFDFYEDRQKRILEKKAKQQHFQKQAWAGKPTDEKNKDGTIGELKLQKSSEVASDLVKEPTSAIQTNGDIKLSENGPFVKSGDAPKGANQVAVSENKVVANGVANCC